MFTFVKNSVMKEKITFLMRSEGLSTTRLAELLEIQPSAVSHLASGRNKPSYDLLQKILVRFPRINPDWLLLGTGDPYRAESPTLADENSQRATTKEENMNLSEESATIDAAGERLAASAIPINIRGQITTSGATKNPIFVVVFYDDGSCENFSMR